MASLVTSFAWTDKPVDKRIFGSFIEAGFGRQLSGMWSEMLFNRSFRKIPPYQIATWEWLGIEAFKYNESAPFWHSGYEEFDWELFGNCSSHHTIGSRTYKGMSSFELNNLGGISGLRQKGLHLQSGRSYKFSLYGALRGWLGEAGLNGFGDSSYEDIRQPLRVSIGKYETEFMMTTEAEEYNWTFTADETECVCIQISFAFDGGISLSWASLMPTDNIGGWRSDVVETLRETGTSVIRFPGGCYASFYDWRDTVGPRNRREPQTSFYWGGLEENDVGLDEFMHLSALAGFEPQICFNMMTSDPFTARGLVEYLNAPSDVGYGRYRALNGHEKGYGVTLFEMDNEPARKWSARQYAKACVEFAEEMRLSDPSIQFMFAAYSYPIEALKGMLEIAGKHINYVIYRQGEPSFVAQALEIIREYNRKNGTDLKLVNTEWLPPFASVESFENPQVPVDYEWRGIITNDYCNIISTQQTSWNYALNGAHRLLDYMSYGEDFAIANFNNMCNTWGQNLIEADKDTCYLSNMGEVFRYFKEHFIPCAAASVESDDPKVFALATKDGDGKVCLYIVNHSAQCAQITLPEGTWTPVDGIRGMGRLNAMKRDVKSIEPCKAQLSAEKATVPGLSITRMVLQ